MSLSLVPAQTVWQSTRNRKREDLWHAEGCKCHWCGRPTRLCTEDVADQATIEHIIPQAKGGTNDPSNLTSACRLCNARRSYEQAQGLPEGSLLGQFPVTDRQKRAFGAPRLVPRQNPKPRYVALTADDKKALFSKTVKHNAENVLREQRDQALRELTHVRNELKLFHKIVEDQEKELKSMTVWKLIRKRIAEKISP